jgi:hypothetical protein
VFQVLGPSNPLVGIDNYQNTLFKLVETAGIRSPEQFFREVAPETVQQFEQQIAQKPDPKQLELQGKGQLEMQKLQAMQQIEQAVAAGRADRDGAIPGSASGRASQGRATGADRAAAHPGRAGQGADAPRAAGRDRRAPGASRHRGEAVGRCRQRRSSRSRSSSTRSSSTS